jgi:alkanesulfonate monooxygenase SsuD/methylene tetrahydromethanopterin reductase-like flavin-dependent oxidoreductase (luciferase family)
MRFGVYYTFQSDAPEDLPEVYERSLDQVPLVEELGYDYAFVSEHHFVEDGYLPALLPMLAAFAARTSRIGIGTYLALLPMHNAIRFAEDAAVVDRISKGRLTIGVGAGYRPAEFRGFDLDRTKRGPLMEHALTTLKRSWADGEVLEGIEVFPKPAHPIPLWVGGFARSAVDRAVRLGDGYMIGGAREKVVKEGVPDPNTPFGAYMTALEKHGRTAEEVPLIGNRVVHVAPTDDQAWDEIGEYVMQQHNTYAKWFEEAGEKGGGTVGTLDDLPIDDYIIGSPETCRRKIESYREALPIQTMTFNARISGVPWDVATRSLELFANEVMPHFDERREASTPAAAS